MNPFDINDQDPYPMYNDGIDPEEERRKWAMEALDQPAQPEPGASPMSWFERMRQAGQVYDPGMTGNAGQAPRQQQPMGGGSDPYGASNLGQQTGRAIGNLYGLFAGGQ